MVTIIEEAKVEGPIDGSVHGARVKGVLSATKSRNAEMQRNAWI